MTVVVLPATQNVKNSTNRVIAEAKATPGFPTGVISICRSPSIANEQSNGKGSDPSPDLGHQRGTLQQQHSKSLRNPRKDRSGAPNRRYMVEKIMVSDEHESKGPERASGRFFAMSSAQNGTESMFSIEIDSLQTLGWKNVHFAVTAETEIATRLPLSLLPKPRIYRGNYRRAGTIIRKRLVSWCLEHPGFSVAKVGPGARGQNDETKRYYKAVAAKILGTRTKGGCLKYAVLNAVIRIMPGAVLKQVEVVFRKFPRMFKSIGGVQRILHGVSGRLNLRKVKKKSFKVSKLDWLGAIERGMFLVQLRASNEVGHCILIDGSAREIIDIEERFVLELSKAAVVACGGKTEDKLYVAEVRELYDAASN